MPAELAVGAGTAVFVAGTCFAPGERLESLVLLVDGEEQTLGAFGMPRLETLRAHEPDGYRSGFWGMAQIRSAPVTLALRARLAGGAVEEAPLATIPAAPPVDPVAADASVAVCMTTCDPPMALFRRQIESIRAQTHADWVCVISDDCSEPERHAAIQEALGEDPRFVISRTPRRIGFYRNFERALSLAPADATHVALADQDDAWHPDKLATLLAELGDAKLVYSDARVVDGDGRVLADTYWSRRTNNHRDLLSLLVANSVTGAASLFPRSLLDDALPFPPAQFAHFHDHWLAVVALSLGDIAFVGRPLYDYVQHGGATLGHAAANRMPGMRERLEAVRRDPRERIRLWRMHYYVDACRLLQFTMILRLRCWRADGGGQAAGDRALRARRPLAARPRRAGVAGRAGAAGPPPRHARGGVDARPRVRLAAPARRQHARRAEPRRAARLAAAADLRPAAGRPRPRRPGRPRGGREDHAAAAGGERPRAAAGQPADPVDRPPALLRGLHRQVQPRAAARRARRAGADRHRRPGRPLPESWRRDVEAYSGLAGMLDEVEVEFGRESQGIEMSREDALIATTWWTAHLANTALRQLDAERFLYLIQEYEPFTFPMGSYAALAAESYTFPHTAVFSTELLRDYFRRHALGVYAAADGDAVSTSFDNAITAIDPPAAAELAGRAPRRLLFYARPEPHAARNMFELGVLALSRALERGTFADGWELHGIGSVRAGRRLDLGGGALMELRPRAPQAGYGDFLRGHDVGLALMFTPHPSLVPLEMASAGLLTVTNTFENKTAAAMEAISPNLIAAEPGIAAVEAALDAAAARVDDVGARVRGSAVRWPRDWDESFAAPVLDRVISLLRG